MLVILLKGSLEGEETEDVDKYERALLPVPSMRVPVLGFELVDDGVRALEQYAFESVFAPSPRTVWALEKMASVDLRDRLRDVPWFVVGKGTEKAAAETFGVKSIYGSETGSAEKLIELLHVNSFDLHNVAYICGSLRKSTLSDGLKELGVTYREFIVYKTIPDTSSIIPPTPHGTKRACVFFSPSGITAVGNQITSDDFIIAIGETTSKALREANIPVHSVCCSPTPEGVQASVSALSKLI